jgi:hypothetical protein
VPIRGGPARCASRPLQPPRQQRQPAEVAPAPSMTRAWSTRRRPGVVERR